MTNEELVRLYYDGDEDALDKLYRRNLGLIRSIAKEAAKEFNCLHMDSDRPEEFSGYTKTILDDLCGEGALEFLTRLQSREYDESRAMLTTYLYPHLKGRMTRWLERKHRQSGFEQRRYGRCATGAENVPFGLVQR